VKKFWFALAFLAVTCVTALVAFFLTRTPPPKEVNIVQKKETPKAIATPKETPTATPSKAMPSVQGPAIAVIDPMCGLLDDAIAASAEHSVVLIYDLNSEDTNKVITGLKEEKKVKSIIASLDVAYMLTEKDAETKAKEAISEFLKNGATGINFARLDSFLQDGKVKDGSVETIVQLIAHARTQKPGCSIGLERGFIGVKGKDAGLPKQLLAKLDAKNVFLVASACCIDQKGNIDKDGAIWAAAMLKTHKDVPVFVLDSLPPGKNLSASEKTDLLELRKKFSGEINFGLRAPEKVLIELK